MRKKKAITISLLLTSTQLSSWQLSLKIFVLDTNFNEFIGWSTEIKIHSTDFWKCIECCSFNEINTEWVYIDLSANRATNLSNSLSLLHFHAFQWLYKSWSFNSITISSTSNNGGCVLLVFSFYIFLLPQPISFTLFSLRYAHTLHCAPYLWFECEETNVCQSR